jgi:hypothetical protein
LVVLAEEFDFFGLVRLAVSDLHFFGGAVAPHAACSRLRVLLDCLTQHWKPRKHLVIHWQRFWQTLMHNLVVRAGNSVVLNHFLAALETEGMTTGQRQGLLILVVIGFKAHTAFKY